MELPDQVKKGIVLFNSGQFFEAHESLEEAWRAEKGSIRELYQGILQVGVACYHMQHGNLSGAQHLLDRGLIFLNKFDDDIFGIDLASFKSAANDLKKTVERYVDHSALQFEVPTFPQITFVHHSRGD